MSFIIIDIKFSILYYNWLSKTVQSSPWYDPLNLLYVSPPRWSIVTSQCVVAGTKIFFRVADTSMNFSFKFSNFQSWLKYFTGFLLLSSAHGMGTWRILNLLPSAWGLGDTKIFLSTTKFISRALLANTNRIMY